jgi:hypothetical protein
MNAPFSTYFKKDLPEILASKPTHFVPKIWMGIMQHKLNAEPMQSYFTDYVFLQRELQKDYKLDVTHPKLHTIREDATNRWKTGNLIHFYIYSRSKNQLRFAPILKCVSTQKIEIIWTDSDNFRMAIPCVYVNNRWIVGDQLDQLAINDGFNNLEEFFAYFNTDFKGKIIHWTDLKY